MEAGNAAIMQTISLLMERALVIRKRFIEKQRINKPNATITVKGSLSMLLQGKHDHFFPAFGNWKLFAVTHQQ